MSDKGKKKALDELKRMRDELRVKFDLASKETKRWWDEDLEPQLAGVEDKLMRGGEKAAEASKTVAEELAGAFRRIRDRVGNAEDAPAAKEAAPAADADDDDVADAEIVDGDDTDQGA